MMASRFLQGSPARLLIVFGVAAALFSSVLSNVATTVIFLSIAMGLAEELDFPSGSRYGEALFISIAWGAGITVELTDGTRVESVKAECKGDPEAALTADEMIAKARDLMRYAGMNDSARIVDGVLDLANGGKSIDVSDFLVA